MVCLEKTTAQKPFSAFLDLIRSILPKTLCANPKANKGKWPPGNWPIAIPSAPPPKKKLIQEDLIIVL